MSLCMHCSLQWSSWVLRGKYTSPGLSGHDVWVAPTNTHQTRTSLLPPIMSSWTMWAASLVMWTKQTVAISLLVGGSDTVYIHMAIWWAEHSKTATAIHYKLQWKALKCKILVAILSCRVYTPRSITVSLELPSALAMTSCSRTRIKQDLSYAK